MTWTSFLLVILLVLNSGLSAANEVGSTESGSTSQAEAVTAEVEAKAPSKELLTEEQIPVQMVAKKSEATAPSSPIQRAVSVIGVMMVLIVGGFVAVKRYAQKSNKKSNGMEIKFLSQHYLGPKKSLAVIRVAGESILIGLTEHNISHIKTLSLLDEDIPQDVAKDFDQELTASVKKSAQTSAQNRTESEEFSFSGIKDIVSNRLKNMRSLE